MATEIDTSNDCLVGVMGDGIVILKPRTRLSKNEALRLAAWLAVLAEDEEGEFEKVLDAVRAT